MTDVQQIADRVCRLPGWRWADGMLILREGLPRPVATDPATVECVVALLHDHGWEIGFDVEGGTVRWYGVRQYDAEDDVRWHGLKPLAAINNLGDLGLDAPVIADLALSGAGGLDTGVVAAGTTCALYVIDDPTGMPTRSSATYAEAVWLTAERALS